MEIEETSTKDFAKGQRPSSLRAPGTRGSVEKMARNVGESRIRIFLAHDDRSPLGAKAKKTINQQW
jgi:hypothetical protein